MKYKYFFTVTSGRTGSAWLSAFLGENLGIHSIHEPLGIDDFGLRMPDIKLMRTFNDRGNTDDVKNFWSRKLDEIAAYPGYAETNHTLAKCGLVENLVEHDICADTCLIVLRRDFAKQCVSYLNRGSFLNITMDWQWHLSHRYRNNMVSFADFKDKGLVGKVLWYIFEMDTRQHYYQKLFSDRVDFVSVNLEQITTASGAQDFLRKLDTDRVARVPGAKNSNKVATNQKLIDEISRILQSINYDPEEIIKRYIAAGRTLSKVNLPE